MYATLWRYHRGSQIFKSQSLLYRHSQSSWRERIDAINGVDEQRGKGKEGIPDQETELCRDIEAGAKVSLTKSRRAQDLVSFFQVAKPQPSPLLPLWRLPVQTALQAASVAVGSVPTRLTKMTQQPWPWDKNAFYSCVSGQTFTQHCQSSLVFDASCSCCNRWHVCHSREANLLGEKGARVRVRGIIGEVMGDVVRREQNV